MSGLTAALFFVAACGGGSSAPRGPRRPGPDPPPPDTPVLTRTVVLQGLSNPWDVALRPTARCSSPRMPRPLRAPRRRHCDAPVRHERLRARRAGPRLHGTERRARRRARSGVRHEPDAVRLHAVQRSPSPRTNRVVRLVLNAGYTSAGNRTDIITDIAFKDAGNGVGGAGAHSGGRIRFGPDGFLYVTTGDNHNPTLPQSPTLLGGKVLRVTTTGAAAPGNAPPAGFDARIFTYGHRNVQGITSARNGPAVHLRARAESQRRGHAAGQRRERRLGSAEPAGALVPRQLLRLRGQRVDDADDRRGAIPNAMRPSWSNDGASQGMGPAEFLVGKQWGAWNGRLAVGSWPGRGSSILELNAAGIATSASTRRCRRSLPRAHAGPDGNLYVATDAGEIWRVTPSAASP